MDGRRGLDTEPSSPKTSTGTSLPPQTLLHLGPRGGPREDPSGPCPVQGESRCRVHPQERCVVEGVRGLVWGVGGRGRTPQMVGVPLKMSEVRGA